MTWTQNITLISSAIFLIVSTPTQAQFAGAKRLPELKKGISKLIEKSGIKKSQLGIYITDNLEGSNKVSFELNARNQFIPASTTKIFTAGAALEKFPVGHQFKTQLLAEALPDGSVIKGNIYLKGGGDAAFVSESMWFLVNEFMRNGVQVIQGDIVVDDTHFDNVRFDPGRDPARKDRAYDAPIGAMTFNWSAVNVYVRPGKKVGDPAKVYIDPENRYIKLDNKAVTGKPGSGLRLNVTRAKKKNGDTTAGDKVIVTGSIGLNRAEKVYYKSITQPDYWSGYQLLEFLRQRGIEVAGGIRLGKTPESALVLAEAKSKAVGDIVKDMMKFSNNYVAEILTKALGAEFRSAPGTMAKGLAVLNDYIQSKKIAKTDYQLTSPSGLSRTNKFRAIDIHKVLIDLKSNFSVFAEYLGSNPIGGVDGTLKNRFKKPPAFGRVRAKSGQLNGVATLAGYMGRADGYEYNFVFLFNGAAIKVPRAQQLMGDIADLLLK